MKVTIDCPNCASRIRVNVGVDRDLPPVACDDCGFTLNLPGEKVEMPIRRCIVCGANRFFSERVLLGKPFLGMRAVCYVCEAKYAGATGPSVSRGYDQGVLRTAELEAAMKGLEERVDNYGAAADGSDPDRSPTPPS